jgi:hypothetical protein
MLQNDEEPHGGNRDASDVGIGNDRGFRVVAGTRSLGNKIANTGSWLAGGPPRFSAQAFGMLDRDGGVSRSTFQPS